MTSMTQHLIAPAQLINGNWSEPEHTLETQLTDPETGTPRQAGVKTAESSVHEAIIAAQRTHRASPEGFGSPEQRRAALELAATFLDEYAESIALQDSLNSGVPLTITRLIAGALGDTCRAAVRHEQHAPDDLGQHGRHVFLHHLPLGPAAVLAPWNAPTTIAAKKIAYAWAAGCPVIIKPSPLSPNGTRLLVEAFSRAAQQTGLPPSSIQLVLGGAETGRMLVSSPSIRAISFTGSREAGTNIAAAAATHHPALQLELGSNNPAVITPDADIETTAMQLAAGMTKLNGAWCESPGTVYVPAALRDHLIEALTTSLAEHVIGPPLEPATTFGPQANAAQYTDLRTRLENFEASGARIITCGQTPEVGWWIPPTLVLDPPVDLARRETFGPVLVIHTCDDPEAALAASFELHTGLAGYVFTQSLAEGLRIGHRLPAGEIKINGTSILDMSAESAQTFWYGSGIGGHGDAQLARFFLGARIVGQDVDSPL